MLVQMISLRRPRGVVVNELDYNIGVSVFEFQSRCSVYSRTNSFGKGMNSFIPSAMG